MTALRGAIKKRHRDMVAALSASTSPTPRRDLSMDSPSFSYEGGIGIRRALLSHEAAVMRVTSAWPVKASSVSSQLVTTLPAAHCEVLWVELPHPPTSIELANDDGKAHLAALRSVVTSFFDQERRRLQTGEGAAAELVPLYPHAVDCPLTIDLHVQQRTEPSPCTAPTTASLGVSATLVGVAVDTDATDADLYVSSTAAPCRRNPMVAANPRCSPSASTRRAPQRRRIARPAACCDTSQRRGRTAP